VIQRSRLNRLAIWIMIACGIWLAALGVYFIVLRPPLLPEDPRFIGATLAQLRLAAPGLEGWLRIVFTVMGGYMVGAGVLTPGLVRIAMLRRFPGSAWALGLAGLSTVVLMSAMNFVLHSDFRWVLAVPATLWIAGVAAYVASD
jgi:hypothetical protein